MILAKVIGNVWSTRKDATLVAWKLMLVKQLDPLTGALTGKTQLAVDGNTGAGIGDTVLILDEGGGARMIMQNEKAPVRTIICGVVDKITIDKPAKETASLNNKETQKSKSVKKAAK